MYFVHRYIRLTGVYAIVIGLHATLLKFFATGVQSSFVSNAVENCQETWWINLLYLNNLKWMSDSPMDCIGVTW
jgi:peptidoglycan/LPS O-acetylase OafA/YrhL